MKPVRGNSGRVLIYFGNNQWHCNLNCFILEYYMSRRARQAVADIPYHIINRGNNRQPVFFCDDDYKYFLDAIMMAKESYPCEIYSFVLMTNHIHLLLEAVNNNDNLALFMKQVSQRYGQHLNKQYKRSGTIWEGRFKSSPISQDRYLLACGRYIEMNPVRAGIVSQPEEYPFSSYRSKIGFDEKKWLDFDPMYMLMGETNEQRCKKYREWFQESIPQDEWDMIRKSIKRNWPYGGNRFKKDMEIMLGRKFELEKVGRKPKNK